MASPEKRYFTKRFSKTTAVSTGKQSATKAIANGLEHARVDYAHTPDDVVLSRDMGHKGGSIALRLIATNALIDLVQATSTPAAVKAACARTLLELCGAIGARKNEYDDGADPEVMSLADIDKRLKALDDERI